MECLFCNIATGAIPADTVFENEEIKIFKDIHPKAPVHVLVIPKAHIQSIGHLESGHREIVAGLIYGAKDTAMRLGLTGYKLVFNVGREGGQVIDHLHLHILGGWSEGQEKKINV